MPDGQVSMAAVWEIPSYFWAARFQQRPSLSVWLVIARCLLMKKTEGKKQVKKKSTGNVAAN